MKRKINTHLLIQGFALLHALTALVCRAGGITDELPLTMVTILMVVLVCIQRRTSIEFTAVAVVIGNLAGYAIGFVSARLVGLAALPDMATYPIATFLTTEIIGYGTLACSAFARKNEGKANEEQIIWIIAAVAVIYIVRVSMSLLFSYNIFGGMTVSREFLYFLASSFSLVVVLLIFLSTYAIREKKTAQKEKEKRHLAQFKYMRLNQQVNPHFLFNSLNILDCIVAEGNNELASTYIHKLAGIYRYMLKSEDETLVKLSDEMVFVGLYVDLLKLRFQEGLEVETDIPEELSGRSVVPCSLQLLIENATKHNAVSPDRPLRITVKASDGRVSVENNRIPKMSPVASTGLGLKYIRQQYQDLANAEIQVEENDESYKVTLPIL